MEGKCIGNGGTRRRPVPSKRSSMMTISSPSNIQSVRQRRSSLATSTPFASETTSWWWRIRDDELSNETKKWKATVAAEAHFMSPQPPKDTPKRGRRASSIDNTGDSDLFLVPEETDGSYGSLSIFTHLILVAVSVILTVMLGAALRWFDCDFERAAFVYITSTIAFYVTSSTIVQELWYSPIQVSTSYLSEKSLLPSVFSNIDTVEVEDDDGPYALDIHYLHTKGGSGSIEIDAIYCNHGFGAWSLIWLPIMRRLAQELHVSHVLSHDTVGFGLTSRPPVEHLRDLRRYGFSFSAGIGLALLERTLSFYSKKSLKQSSNIVLIGHSMGSLTTLRMALQIPESTKVKVILVAPAVLGLDPTRTNGKTDALQLTIASVSNILTKLYAPCLPFIRLMRIILVDPPCYFLLKRVIAFRPFWRMLLWYCCGDKSSLSDNDVERYRWPSIVDGCVEGVIHFLRAQPFCHGFLSYPGGDLQLLSDVLERPNVLSVTIIQGTLDPLIPPANSRRLARLFPLVHLEELTGVGHDPVAESPGRLMAAVHNVLEKPIISA